MSTTNRQVLFASRPEGPPAAENFKLVESPVPTPGDGEMLLRTIYLSLDPYMRGRMNTGRSYAKGAELGQPMVGGTIARVVKSNIPGFSEGDFVVSSNGWQEYAVSNGAGVRKIDPANAPISTGVGVLGMPGMTAYVGLLAHGRPKEGETVVISAASGAVGSAVGQIAKIKGCRAVGIAGGPDKCAYVRDELGFDECVDYKAPDFKDALKAACPGGVDIYFENVGGIVFDTVLDLMNDYGRIPVCGRIANYNDTEAPPGPNMVPKLMGIVLTRRLTIRGFIVSNHPEYQEDFLRDMGGWIREGRVKYREDIVEGLENAVSAFQGLLKGKNFGKQLVRVSPDPTR